MARKVKSMRQKLANGTFSSPIPFGVDAIYVDLSDGTTAQAKFNSLDSSISNLGQRITTLNSQIATKFLDYYTKTQSDARYYTQTQINTKFGDYYTSAQVDGLLDDYYTANEVDTKLTNNYYTKTYINNNYYTKTTYDNYDDGRWTDVDYDSNGNWL